MRVVMYMAISVNGMIAKGNDDTSWISLEEWNSYSLAVRNAGNLIIGRRMYHILTKQPEFSELKDVTLVVVSKTNFKTLSPKHLVVNSPQEALKMVSRSKEVIVAGGGILNHAFLSENLVDEIFLDIEPIILSNGIPLFKGNEYEQKLKLIGQKKISENVLQLHYQILK